MKGTGSLTVLATAFLTILLFPPLSHVLAEGSEPDAGANCALVGAGTPGYWKNHPEAWPGSVIWIGGRPYSRDEAIALMKQPGKGDKTYALFSALVAAKLNTEVNWACRHPYWECIVNTLIAAHGWMGAYPVGSGMKASSSAWQSAECLYLLLDAFNNGELCMPSRDSLGSPESFESLAAEDTGANCALVGAGTPGYWKNHPEAWPGPVIWIGGRPYSREEAIGLMEQPGKGDKTYTLFSALVAAKLNTEVNWAYRDPYWECIADTLIVAHGWLNAHPVGSGVKASSSAWQWVESVHVTLDAFNNGELCMPSRDSLEGN